MGTPLVGDVVLIPFPYSDPSKTKRRPALVVADVGRSDYVLCQITGKPYDDPPHEMSLDEVGFSNGCLRRESFVCEGKLFAANQILLLDVAGCSTDPILVQVISILVGMFPSALADCAF